MVLPTSPHELRFQSLFNTLRSARIYSLTDSCLWSQCTDCEPRRRKQEDYAKKTLFIVVKVVHRGKRNPVSTDTWSPVVI